MSEQVETAQPTTEVAGGQTAPETISAPETTISSSPEPAREQALTLDQILSKRYDEMQTPKATAEEAAPPAEAKPDQAPPAASEPAQSSPAIAAPQSWSAEQQAKFATLPPDVQQYVHAREQQASQLISRQGAELKAFQPLREVYGALNSWGVPQGREAEVVQSWAKAQAFLDANPVEGLKWLAQSYGVDPAQLSGQPKQADPATQGVDDLFKDPRVDQLQATMGREIQQLRQQLGQVGGHLTAREQAETAQRTQYVANAVQKFASDPARAQYFPILEDEITHEVNYVKAREPGLPIEKVLEKAFNRAANANDHVREQMQAAGRKAEAEKAQKEAAARQQKAKTMAAMNVRTGAGASTPTFDGKWDDRDKLGALYDKIASR